MKRIENQDGTITFELSPSDIESAIRSFICTCHPDLSSGWIVDPQTNAEQDYTAATFLATPTLK